MLRELPALLCVLTLARGAGADDPASPAAPVAPAPVPTTAPAAEPGANEPAWSALARRLRRSVVTVQVRAPGGQVTTRNAVLVDSEGWLVLAGPPPGPRDTLVAAFPRGTFVPAQPVGRDAESALTLLQVLQPPPELEPVVLPVLAPHQALPAPGAPGTAVLMVTGDGAVARGKLRATDRMRTIADPSHGGAEEVSGLLEASLASVAHDLGSPWFDAEGRLIGLLVGGVAELPAGAPSEGLVARPEPVAAHAVSAAVVALVWPLLKAGGTFPRSRLGVLAEPVTEALRRHLCNSCGGYVVRAVEPGGPAAGAGLEVNDLILAIEGAALRPDATLRDALLPYRPSESVELTIVHRGERAQIRITLGSR